jgi:hypothetical protein
MVISTMPFASEVRPVTSAAPVLLPPTALYRSNIAPCTGISVSRWFGPPRSKDLYFLTSTLVNVFVSSNLNTLESFVGRSTPPPEYT